MPVSGTVEFFNEELEATPELLMMILMVLVG